jgi:CheY-like chemotaxis protein
MGGFCFAKSKGLGKGASFCVCLPQVLKEYQLFPAKVLSYNSTYRSTLGDSTNFSQEKILVKIPKRILLAEDNVMVQKMLKLLIEKCGYEVTCFTNGKEAVDEYFTRHSTYYSCVCLDYEMPVMTGVEASKKIRAANFRIPIIVLTAHTTEKDKEECMQSGASDFLTKPITLEILRSTLKKWNSENDVQTTTIGTNNNRKKIDFEKCK